jgi:transcriptional regulator with GAF, ATPase, and Fis domain
LNADGYTSTSTSLLDSGRTPEGQPELVGDSAAFLLMRARLEQVAATDATVLLLGETGTGKTVAASLIHSLSARRRCRFVAVDCTALPATLIESELFGRERGAFTDAHTAQPGRFELANGGTVFLDEVGELPLQAQVKLLRVLQYREFERLGSPRTIHVDVRVVAATNRDLMADVRAGRFRRDLYYRLSVFPVTVPPLRQRRGDIPALAGLALDRLSRRHRRETPDLPKELLDNLVAYDWPGNVRELENVLERALIMSAGGTLRLAAPLVDQLETAAAAGSPQEFTDVQRTHILQVLESRRWRVEGSNGAAAALGLRPSTLRSRMRKLGISRDWPVRVPAWPS